MEKDLRFASILSSVLFSIILPILFTVINSQTLFFEEVPLSLIVGISIVLPLVTIIIAYSSNIKAIYNLFSIGKIRGMWLGKDLDKQIIKHFDKSEIIRIKVTRAHKLIASENNQNFYKAIHSYNGDKDIKIQLMLLLPCKKYKHFQARRNLYTMTDEEFFKTWDETLSLIDNVNNSKKHINIEVKFVDQSHSRWRFYLFESLATTTLFLNDYDGKTSGNKSPMYKIYNEKNTICGFMVRYFDDLWEQAINLSHYNEIIKKCTNCRKKVLCGLN